MIYLYLLTKNCPVLQYSTIFTKKTALNPNTNKIICIFATAKSKVDIFTIEKDIAKRIENFNISKRYCSRLFGAGKSSKNTPTELLEKTRILYEKINNMLEQWEGEKEV